MPSSETPLTIANISKQFGSQQVLNDISLTVKQGEIFGLIGLNGIGKTTLIKTILDLLCADTGTISIFGVRSTQPKSRKHLTYLPEKFMPTGYLKGKEFLKLSLSYSQKPVDNMLLDPIAQMLSFDLHNLPNTISHYSKGMAQKLGLISAFMCDTPLLVLDEPMSGLDPLARIGLKQLFQETKAKGHSIFFSSHILSDIEEMCDNIGVIHNGTLLYTGTTQAFRNAYPAESLELSFLDAIKK